MHLPSTRRGGLGGLGVLWYTAFWRTGSSPLGSICKTDVTGNAGGVAGLTLPPPEHQRSSMDAGLPQGEVPTSGGENFSFAVKEDDIGESA